MSMKINVKRCTLCGTCAEVCTEDAIIPADDKDGNIIYKVIDKKCISCGICVDNCNNQAISEVSNA